MSEKKQITKTIRVYGIVQGVGFRPFVSRIADSAGVTGSVANKGSYVEIFVKGDEDQHARFRQDLEHKAPERSAILKIDEDLCEDKPFTQFDIIESEKETGDIFVSPDIATCPKCKQELYDPTNRRYMHPFINCTACGPRLTILDSMPYDRERTSMGEFPMCPECEYEYTHSETRRYDAQPVCCNECGPEVYEPWGRGQVVISGEQADISNYKMRGRDAITHVRKALIEGKIIAIKGIGGFHLCCDATNEEAVSRLRQLKHRPAKPFAVMMKDLDTVRQYCEINEIQEEVLDGHQKPIILLKSHTDLQNSTPAIPLLAPSVAPDNPKIGVMLPYAPVQMLLFDYNDDVDMSTKCLVMTSGNVSGAPICRTDEDAIKELGSFCDIILSHNRKIRLRADDSVMDFYEDKPYMIRRSRGYAPLPIMKSEPWKGQVLAVGGELKNTFCIGKNQLLYPSPFVGDMADLRTVRALEESIKRMEELLETQPEIVVCDLHPKYNTTVVAEEQGLPVLQIQHHYAHILSCMAENDVSMDEKVIGVSFDGTGYGTDGTIWGGEILTATYHDFQRVASIQPFMQIGGDASAKEGWRIALSMINDIYGEEAPQIVEKLNLCESSMQKLYLQMAKKKINSVISTSAGRLFDAISAILGVRLTSSFEGEASTTLQFRAEAYEGSHTEETINMDVAQFLKKYPELLAINQIDIEDNRNILPTDRLTQAIIQEYLSGENTCKLAYLFHASLAQQIIQACKYISEETCLQAVALSGGVFQNQLLLKLCDKGLQKCGLHVYKHSLIPPNDGGLALGQAAAGMARLQTKKNR